MHYRYYDRYVVTYESRESGGAEGDLVGDEVDTRLFTQVHDPGWNKQYILPIELY